MMSFKYMYTFTPLEGGSISVPLPILRIMMTLLRKNSQGTNNKIHGR